MMLSVIVPTYEEARTLGALLVRVAAVRERLGAVLEVLVVDDASGDGTPEVAEEFFAATPIGRVIRRQGPRDLAGAVREGIRSARGEWIAVMDADLSHPPELLPELVAAIRSGYHVAVASRYVAGGGVVNWPWQRRLLSRLGALMARPLVSVADPTSGYFVADAPALAPLTREVHGFKILLDVLVRGTLQRVIEVPYVFVDRAGGASKLSRRVLWCYLQQLGRLYARRVAACCHPRRMPWNEFRSPSSS